MTIGIRPLVYVAGPISKGELLDNIMQAHQAGLALMRLGYVPVVPHGSCFWGNHMQDEAFVPESLHSDTTHEQWVEMDLHLVARCDAVLRLPGESTGADKECRLASLLGIPVYESLEAMLLNPPIARIYTPQRERAEYAIQEVMRD